MNMSKEFRQIHILNRYKRANNKNQENSLSAIKTLQDPDKFRKAGKTATRPYKKNCKQLEISRCPRRQFIRKVF